MVTNGHLTLLSSGPTLQAVRRIEKEKEALKRQLLEAKAYFACIEQREQRSMDQEQQQPLLLETPYNQPSAQGLSTPMAAASPLGYGPTPDMSAILNDTYRTAARAAAAGACAMGTSGAQQPPAAAAHQQDAATPIQAALGGTPSGLSAPAGQLGGSFLTPIHQRSNPLFGLPITPGTGELAASLLGRNCSSSSKGGMIHNPMFGTPGSGANDQQPQDSSTGGLEASAGGWAQQQSSRSRFGSVAGPEGGCLTPASVSKTQRLVPQQLLVQGLSPSQAAAVAVTPGGADLVLSPVSPAVTPLLLSEDTLREVMDRHLSLSACVARSRAALLKLSGAIGPEAEAGRDGVPGTEAMPMASMDLPSTALGVGIEGDMAEGTSCHAVEEEDLSVRMCSREGEEGGAVGEGPGAVDGGSGTEGQAQQGQEQAGSPQQTSAPRAGVVAERVASLEQLQPSKLCLSSSVPSSPAAGQVAKGKAGFVRPEYAACSAPSSPWGPPPGSTAACSLNAPPTAAAATAGSLPALAGTPSAVGAAAANQHLGSGSKHGIRDLTPKQTTRPTASQHGGSTAVPAMAAASQAGAGGVMQPSSGRVSGRAIAKGSAAAARTRTDPRVSMSSSGVSLAASDTSGRPDTQGLDGSASGRGAEHHGSSSSRSAKASHLPANSAAARRAHYAATIARPASGRKMGLGGSSNPASAGGRSSGRLHMIGAYKPFSVGVDMRCDQAAMSGSIGKGWLAESAAAAACSSGGGAAKPAAGTGGYGRTASKSSSARDAGLMKHRTAGGFISWGGAAASSSSAGARSAGRLAVTQGGAAKGSSVSSRSLATGSGRLAKGQAQDSCSSDRMHGTVSSAAAVTPSAGACTSSAGRGGRGVGSVSSTAAAARKQTSGRGTVTAFTASAAAKKNSKATRSSSSNPKAADRRQTMGKSGKPGKSKPSLLPHPLDVCGSDTDSEVEISMFEIASPPLSQGPAGPSSSIGRPFIPSLALHALQAHDDVYVPESHQLSPAGSEGSPCSQHNNPDANYGFSQGEVAARRGQGSSYGAGQPTAPVRPPPLNFDRLLERVSVGRSQQGMSEQGVSAGRQFDNTAAVAQLLPAVSTSSCASSSAGQRGALTPTSAPIADPATSPYAGSRTPAMQPSFCSQPATFSSSSKFGNTPGAADGSSLGGEGMGRARDIDWASVIGMLENYGTPQPTAQPTPGAAAAGAAGATPQHIASAAAATQAVPSPAAELLRTPAAANPDWSSVLGLLGCSLSPADTPTSMVAATLAAPAMAAGVQQLQQRPGGHQTAGSPALGISAAAGAFTQAVGLDEQQQQRQRRRWEIVPASEDPVGLVGGSQGEYPPSSSSFAGFIPHKGCQEQGASSSCTPNAAMDIGLSCAASAATPLGPMGIKISGVGPVHGAGHVAGNLEESALSRAAESSARAESAVISCSGSAATPGEGWAERRGLGQARRVPAAASDAWGEQSGFAGTPSNVFAGFGSPASSCSGSAATPAGVLSGPAEQMQGVMDQKGCTPSSMAVVRGGDREAFVEGSPQLQAAVAATVDQQLSSCIAVDQTAGLSVPTAATPGYGGGSVTALVHHGAARGASTPSGVPSNLGQLGFGIAASAGASPQAADQLSQQGSRAYVRKTDVPNTTELSTRMSASSSSSSGTDTSHTDQQQQTQQQGGGGHGSSDEGGSIRDSGNSSSNSCCSSKRTPSEALGPWEGSPVRGMQSAVVSRNRRSSLERWMLHGGEECSTDGNQQQHQQVEVEQAEEALLERMERVGSNQLEEAGAPLEEQLGLKQGSTGQGSASSSRQNHQQQQQQELPAGTLWDHLATTPCSSQGYTAAGGGVEGTPYSVAWSAAPTLQKHSSLVTPSFATPTSWKEGGAGTAVSPSSVCGAQVEETPLSQWAAGREGEGDQELAWVAMPATGLSVAAAVAAADAVTPAAARAFSPVQEGGDGSTASWAAKLDREMSVEATEAPATETSQASPAEAASQGTGAAPAAAIASSSAAAAAGGSGGGAGRVNKADLTPMLGGAAPTGPGVPGSMLSTISTGFTPGPPPRTPEWLNDLKLSCREASLQMQMLLEAAAPGVPGVRDSTVLPAVAETEAEYIAAAVAKALLTPGGDARGNEQLEDPHGGTLVNSAAAKELRVQEEIITRQCNSAAGGRGDEQLEQQRLPGVRDSSLPCSPAPPAGGGVRAAAAAGSPVARQLQSGVSSFFTMGESRIPRLSPVAQSQQLSLLGPMLGGNGTSSSCSSSRLAVGTPVDKQQQFQHVSPYKEFDGYRRRALARAARGKAMGGDGVGVAALLPAIAGAADASTAVVPAAADYPAEGARGPVELREALEREGLQLDAAPAKSAVAADAFDGCDVQAATAAGCTWDAEGCGLPVTGMGSCSNLSALPAAAAGGVGSGDLGAETVSIGSLSSAALLGRPSCPTPGSAYSFDLGSAAGDSPTVGGGRSMSLRELGSGGTSPLVHHSFSQQQLPASRLGWVGSVAGGMEGGELQQSRTSSAGYREEEGDEGELAGEQQQGAQARCSDEDQQLVSSRTDSTGEEGSEGALGEGDGLLLQASSPGWIQAMDGSKAAAAAAAVPATAAETELLGGGAVGRSFLDEACRLLMPTADGLSPEPQELPSSSRFRPIVSPGACLDAASMSYLLTQEGEWELCRQQQGVSQQQQQQQQQGVGELEEAEGTSMSSAALLAGTSTFQLVVPQAVLQGANAAAAAASGCTSPSLEGCSSKVPVSPAHLECTSRFTGDRGQQENSLSPSPVAPPAVAEACYITTGSGRMEAVRGDAEVLKGAQVAAADAGTASEYGYQGQQLQQQGQQQQQLLVGEQVTNESSTSGSGSNGGIGAGGPLVREASVEEVERFLLLGQGDEGDSISGNTPPPAAAACTPPVTAAAAAPTTPASAAPSPSMLLLPLASLADVRSSCSNSIASSAADGCDIDMPRISLGVSPHNCGASRRPGDSKSSEDSPMEEDGLTVLSPQSPVPEEQLLLLQQVQEWDASVDVPYGGLEGSLQGTGAAAAVGNAGDGLSLLCPQSPVSLEQLMLQQQVQQWEEEGQEAVHGGRCGSHHLLQHQQQEDAVSMVQAGSEGSEWEEVALGEVGGGHRGLVAQEDGEEGVGEEPCAFEAPSNVQGLEEDALSGGWREGTAARSRAKQQQQWDGKGAVAKDNVSDVLGVADVSSSVQSGQLYSVAAAAVYTAGTPAEAAVLEATAGGSPQQAVSQGSEGPASSCNTDYHTPLALCGSTIMAAADTPASCYYTAPRTLAQGAPSKSWRTPMSGLLPLSAAAAAAVGQQSAAGPAAAAGVQGQALPTSGGCSQAAWGGAFESQPAGLAVMGSSSSSSAQVLPSAAASPSSPQAEEEFIGHPGQAAVGYDVSDQLLALLSTPATVCSSNSPGTPATGFLQQHTGPEAPAADLPVAELDFSSSGRGDALRCQWGSGTAPLASSPPPPAPTVAAGAAEFSGAGIARSSEGDSRGSSCLEGVVAADPKTGAIQTPPASMLARLGITTPQASTAASVAATGGTQAAAAAPIAGSSERSSCSISFGLEATPGSPGSAASSINQGFRFQPVEAVAWHGDGPGAGLGAADGQGHQMFLTPGVGLGASHKLFGTPLSGTTGSAMTASPAAPPASSTPVGTSPTATPVAAWGFAAAGPSHALASVTGSVTSGYTRGDTPGDASCSSSISLAAHPLNSYPNSRSIAPSSIPHDSPATPSCLSTAAGAVTATSSSNTAMAADFDPISPPPPLSAATVGAAVSSASVPEQEVHSHALRLSATSQQQQQQCGQGGWQVSPTLSMLGFIEVGQGSCKGAGTSCKTLVGEVPELQVEQEGRAFDTPHDGARGKGQRAKVTGVVAGGKTYASASLGGGVSTIGQGEGYQVCQQQQREQGQGAGGIHWSEAAEPCTPAPCGLGEVAAGVGGGESARGSSKGVDAGCGGSWDGGVAAGGGGEGICEEGTQTTPLSVFKKWTGHWGGTGSQTVQVSCRRRKVLIVIQR